MGVAGALDLVNLSVISGGTVTVNAQAGQVKLTSTTTKVNNSFITSANDIVILTWAGDPGSSWYDEILYVGLVNASGYFQIKVTGSGGFSGNAKVNFLIINKICFSACVSSHLSLGLNPSKLKKSKFRLLNVTKTWINQKHSGS